MNNETLINSAKNFALVKHGDQRYGKGDSSFPYSKHLQDVADVVAEFGHDDSYLLASAWLHDVIEDTSITFEDVFTEFGKTIARTVYAVTNESGENRAIRHSKTYPKIRVCGRNALVIKLADRIANMRHSSSHNHGMLKMYKKEYVGFRSYLKIPGELKAMWAALDVLNNHLVE